MLVLYSVFIRAVFHLFMLRRVKHATEHLQKMSHFHTTLHTRTVRSKRVRSSVAACMPNEVAESGNN